MSRSPEAVTSPTASLQTLLYRHIEAASSAGDVNAKYVEAAKGKLDKLDGFIKSREGQIRGLAIGWTSDVQPIAENIFGQSLEGRPIGELGGEQGSYNPTVFEGIQGRLRIISVDEIWGPMLSLDLIGQEALERLQR
jgi:hypothetical protein